MFDFVGLHHNFSHAKIRVLKSIYVSSLASIYLVSEVKHKGLSFISVLYLEV